MAHGTSGLSSGHTNCVYYIDVYSAHLNFKYFRILNHCRLEIQIF